MQHYLVDDMGHVWPATDINFSSLADKKPPTYIDASQIVMDFFANWTRYS
jgi:poly(3-hydroxybutyrate) depolymerase